MAVGKDILARTVSEKTGLNLIDSKILTAAFFDAIKDELSAKKRIELRGFGNFAVKECKARAARNPRTGENLAIPTRNVPVFKVSNILLEKLNKEL